MQKKRIHESKIVLRGGKANYGPRTLLRNWQEDREETPAPKFFLRKGFETTKGVADLEAIQSQQRYFGNGIGTDNRRESRNTIYYQSEELTGKPQSITQSAFGSDKLNFTRQFGSEFPLRPPRKLSQNEIRAYRTQWCVDAGCEDRFVTEKTMYHNRSVPSQFQMSHLRKLPNVPVYVQDIQQGLLLRHGPHAMHLLWKVFFFYDTNTSHGLSKQEFKELLKDLDMHLSHDEFEALFRYFDANQSGTISPSEFSNTLLGTLSEDRQAAVQEAWASLDESGEGCVDAEWMIHRFCENTSRIVGNEDSVLATIVREFPHQWGHLIDVQNETKSDVGVISRDEFILYYRRLSPAIEDDQEFSSLLHLSWAN